MALPKGMSKISILIPPATHQHLRDLAYHNPELSISALCRDTMQAAFGDGKPAPPALAVLEPPEAEEWPRVSIYVMDKTKKRAAAEVKRKVGSKTDKRVGSVAKVVAWLVNEKYAPVHAAAA